MARVLFHSPSVRPDPSAPTGPALTAALLLRVLAISHHAVAPTVRFLLLNRPNDDAGRRRRIDAAAACQAARVIRSCRGPRGDGAADLWLCFRPQAAAPDRIGATVTQALGLPSLLVTAGATGVGAVPDPNPSAMIAIGQDAADGAPPRGPTCIRPFLDLATVNAATKTRQQTRAALAARLQLPKETAWLTAVLTDSDGAMDSLATLTAALSRIAGTPWHLVLMLAGPSASDPQRLLSALPRDRVRLVGAVDRRGLLQILSAADLYAWPDVGEAEALALLQAQACGLAAVVGRSPTARDVVVDGRTGRLAEAGNPASFANNLTFLLRHQPFLATYQRAAVETTIADHGLAKAADALDAAIESALESAPRSA